MKKITIVLSILAVLLLMAVMIFAIPYLLKLNQDKVSAKIKSNNNAFVFKTLEIFAQNKNAIPSDIAKKTIEEFNTIQKNPYDESKPFYIYNEDCTGCSKVEADDNLKMVILTTLDKKGTLVARTVISPPSFVTYYKEEDN